MLPLFDARRQLLCLLLLASARGQLAERHSLFSRLAAQGIEDLPIRIDFVLRVAIRAHRFRSRLAALRVRGHCSHERAVNQRHFSQCRMEPHGMKIRIHAGRHLQLLGGRVRHRGERPAKTPDHLQGTKSGKDDQRHQGRETDCQFLPDRHAVKRTEHPFASEASHGMVPPAVRRGETSTGHSSYRQKMRKTRLPGSSLCGPPVFATSQHRGISLREPWRCALFPNLLIQCRL